MAYDRAAIMPAIFERLRNGESLRSVCRDEAMPHIATVELWFQDDADLFAQYTRAREARGDYYADKAISVVDEVPPMVGDTNHQAGDSKSADGNTRMDSAFVAWKRLQSDLYKWTAARMHPNQYADKVKQEVSGPDGGAIQITRIERVIVNPQN